MSTILAFFGPDGILWALGGTVIIAFLAYVRSLGKQSAEAKQAKRDAKAMGERLEMHREATAEERKVAELTDEAARKEALKWSRR